MHREFPFTERLMFGSTGELYSPPSFLSLSLQAALRDSTSGNPSRICIALPVIDRAALFLALGLCLNEISKQVKTEFAPAPEFKIGDKVLFDHVDYIYKGEQTNEHGVFVILGDENPKSSSVRLIRKIDSVRMQHSVSSRKTGKRPKLKRESVIDALLETELGNNTSLFKTSTVLISRLVSTRAAINALSLGCNQTLGTGVLNAFGIASISEGGQLVVWGSHGRKEEPALLVASELLNVRDFLDEDPRPLQYIILDGAAAFNDLVSLDALLGSGISTIAIVSSRDEAAVKQLEKRNFSIWAWNATDAKSLPPEPPRSEEDVFGVLRESLTNAGNFQLNRESCELHPLQVAFKVLKAFRKTLETDHHHASELYERLYRAILLLSRTVASEDEFLERQKVAVRELNDFIQQFTMFLDSEQHRLATEITDNFSESLDSLSKENAKSTTLVKTLERLRREGVRKASVVLSKASFESDRDFLAERFPNGFLEYEKNSSFRLGPEIESVVITGSFNATHMLKIFEEALGKEIHIVCYPHEERWVSDAESRFFGVSLKSEYRKAEIFGLTKNIEDSTPVSTTIQESDDHSLDSIELAISQFKRARIVNDLKLDSSGRKEPARYVTFTQGGHAFLTDNYALRVVNELLREGTVSDKIPRRRLKDLNTGDFVLFREGANEDLIREMADFSLRRKNQEYLRDVSGRWRGTLLDLYGRNGNSLSRLKAVLAENGVERNEMTIKKWLFDDGMIGPRDERDILGIAAAANDENLKVDFEAVCDAISSIRGEHHTAGRKIGDKLINSVKGDLADLTEDTVAIEVTGVGKVYVVCIGTIDDSKLDVPSHKINRYLIQR